jgi:hypothetical protein
MTVDAFSCYSAKMCWRLMASQTCSIAMLPNQRETGFGMIKASRRLPRLRLMTSFAIIPQATFMHVIGLMAPEALRGGATKHVRLLVASRTLRIQMFSCECETGLAVIKPRLAPAILTMTATASRPHTAFMHIVTLVATDTFLHKF